MPQFPFTAKPDPQQLPQWAGEGEGLPDSPILQASNAIRGLVGLGDDSRASRFGELVGAVGSLGGAAKGVHPAVRALLDMLGTKLPEPDLMGALGGSRITSRVHPVEQLKVPQGFVLPRGFDPAARTPLNATEASLVQEGYRGAFNQSPKNAYAEEPWHEYLRQIYPAKRGTPGSTDVRGLGGGTLTGETKKSAAIPELKMVETSPAVRGLHEIGDVVTRAGESDAATKPLHQSQSGRQFKGAPSKFSEDMVREIRASQASVQELVKQYGTSEATIRAIRKRESFNWVKDK